MVLDHVRSLNNVGAIFRTADAFLIEKIYLCGITATPPNRQIQKTALGSTETVAWEYVGKTTEAIKRLKEQGIKICAVEQVDGATALGDFMPEQNITYAFVFGNEVNGVSQDVIDCSDDAIEIPQLGTKHSLNISVSAGIVLWDVFSKLNR